MYGKIFSKMFRQSLMGKGSDVIAVWAFVIANACRGRVDLNPTDLAAAIGEPAEAMQQAIDFLCQPDPNSTCKEYGGCRLVREGQFQYFVPTHEKYRTIKTAEDLMEANRSRVAKWRAKQKGKTENPKSDQPVSSDLFKLEPEASQERDYKNEAVRIVKRINEICGRNYQPERTTIKPIIARLKESWVTFDGIMIMLPRQWEAWDGKFSGDGTPMPTYFRPSTLFGPNFPNYYAAKDQPVVKAGKDGKPRGENDHMVNMRTGERVDVQGKTWKQTQDAMK